MYEVNPLSASMDNFTNFNDRSMQAGLLSRLDNFNPNRNTTRAELNGALAVFDTQDAAARNTMTKDFLRPISRIISASAETALFADLEPLTSVYSEY